jgi:hypothetical protein
MANLTHEDLIILARLLGCHTTGDGELARVADKLMDYAVRTYPGGYAALKPLNIRCRKSSIYEPDYVLIDERR